MQPQIWSSVRAAVFLRQMILWNVGYEAKCDELIKENKAIFSLDLVSDKLAFTYSLKVEDEMAEAIIDIVDICDARGNDHFRGF